MALEIKENRGLFEVKGKVTAQNVDALRAYFLNIIEGLEAFVISIEQVTEMDASGAKLFEELYTTCAQNNRYVAIVGEYNDNIKAIMEITKTDYIFSSDRI